MTPTQFMWKAINPLYEFKKTDENNTCWLCGGECGGDAVYQSEAISKTFCLSDQSKSPNSQLVCYSCAALAQKKTFDDYVDQNPQMELKKGYASSWRNYSHVVSNGNHSCPSRSEWRELIMNPPKPPFLFVMAVSSQKHLIYKSRISGSRDNFFIQMEDDTITVSKSCMTQCMILFEELLNLGFSKKQIESGQYNQKTILKTGLVKFRELDIKLAVFRKKTPLYINLASFVAQKNGTK